MRRILAAGVDGIALFGTTGEGQSLSLKERRAGLDALLAAGIAPSRIIAATGCASLPETVELTRHAVQATLRRRALVLPPFFFKAVTDEGVFASYARVIDGVGDRAAAALSVSHSSGTRRCHFLIGHRASRHRLSRDSGGREG